MCDEGRNVYKFVNKEHRLLKAQVKGQGSSWTETSAGAAAKAAAEVIKAAAADSLALVLTAQYSVEEFEAIVSTFVKDFKSNKIYFWINNKEAFDNFDGLLVRGDKNPNTKGLLKVLEKHGITATWNELSQGLKSGAIKTVVVAAPENQVVFPDFADRVKELSQAQNLIWLQSGQNEALKKLDGNVWLIPMKTFVEKDGTFINHSGLEQKFKKVTLVVSEALTLTEAALLLAGKNLNIHASSANEFLPLNQRLDQVAVEARKKNEFVFKRGNL
jgi:NADH-quinone oxidoreductase subunit G